MPRDPNADTGAWRRQDASRRWVVRMGFAFIVLACGVFWPFFHKLLWAREHVATGKIDGDYAVGLVFFSLLFLALISPEIKEFIVTFPSWIKAAAEWVRSFRSNAPSKPDGDGGADA